MRAFEAFALELATDRFERQALLIPTVPSRDEINDKPDAQARLCCASLDPVRRDGDVAQVFAVSLSQIRPKRNDARANHASYPPKCLSFLRAVRKRRSTRAFALIRTLGRTVGFPTVRPLRSRIEEKF
jgi:hypothetical protein